MRIVTGMIYTEDHKGMVGDTGYIGYYPKVNYEHYHQRISDAAMLLAVLGISKMHIATVVFRQWAKDGPCKPSYFLAFFDGKKEGWVEEMPRYTPGFEYVDDRFYKKIPPWEIRRLSRKIMAVVGTRLRKLSWSPEFVLIPCFAFPAYTHALYDPIDYVSRTVYDLRLHFLASGEEDLMNAAVLADMV